MKKIYSGLFAILFIFTNQADATQCIAHRGDNKFFFENSFASLNSAINKSSHGVEFDVLHTQDGIPIIMHDNTLERVAMNKQGKECPLYTKISNLTYKDIIDNCLLQNQEEIPSLEQFLERLTPLTLLTVIEFKDTPPLETYNLIANYNSHKPELLRLISFKKKTLKKVKKLAKDNLFWRSVKTLALYKQTFRPSKKYGVNIHHSALKYISILKRKNREIGVWTVDKVSLMYKAFSHKLDFITTNDPELCLQAIEDYNNK